MIKKIMVEDELFEFQLNDKTLNIVNQREFNKLTQKIGRKIQSTAYSYRKFGIPNYEQEDLYQELLALLPKAIQKYDKDGKAKFMTYFWKMCYYRVVRLITQHNLHIPQKYADHPKRAIYARNMRALLDSTSLSDVPEDWHEGEVQLGVRPEHVQINDVISEHLLKPLGF